MINIYGLKRWRVGVEGMAVVALRFHIESPLCLQEGEGGGRESL